MQCTNIFFQCTTYIYSVHKCISECTNLFLMCTNLFLSSAQIYNVILKCIFSAQMYFSVHKSISQCTNVFLSAQINFSVHKSISQCTKYFSVHKYIDIPLDSHDSIETYPET